MSLENGIQLLNKNQSFVTDNANTNYWLIAGRVQVSVVEWFDAEKTINRETGRGASLLEVEPTDESNIAIPSFCYQDPATEKQWRFQIKAM